MPNRDELLAAANKPAEEALRLHPFYRGKIQTALKCPIRDYKTPEQLFQEASAAIFRAQETTRLLEQEGIIPTPPGEL